MENSPRESAADRLCRAAADLPNNSRLSRRAERALNDLSDEDAAHILEDIARVALGQFPGEVKPITTLPGRPLQADAGRFRFLFRWNHEVVEIIAVFSKSAQKNIFQGMR